METRMNYINKPIEEYTMKIFPSGFKIYTPKGRVMAKCLDIDDAYSVLNSLNKTYVIY